MITKIEIDGFKSFKDFEMEFTPLTVIAGVNASGKSNLFDALQLLSDLAEMELTKAFDKQRGSAIELFLQYSDKKRVKEMSFAVEVSVDDIVKDNRGNTAKLDYMHFRYEIKIKYRIDSKKIMYLWISHERLINIDAESETTEYITTQYDPLFKENQILVTKDNEDWRYGQVSYTQSALSSSLVATETNKHAFAVREEMRRWKIMHLNPESLKAPTPQQLSKYSISSDGKNLAGVLYQLSVEDEYFLVEIARELTGFIPGFAEVQTGYDEISKSYYFRLKTSDGQIFSSHVLSEGTLCLLALCVMLYDPDQKGVLCFEEPENGVHPHQVRSMLRLLKKLSEPFNESEKGVSQVIVNTHSPIVVDEAGAMNDHVSASVWLMRMNTLIATVGDDRVGAKVTRPTPVYAGIQSPSDFSEQEQKLTMFEVKKYLNSVSGHE